MTATPALTTDLQRQVLLLEDDLRARVAADADLEGRWKQEHQRAVTKERTAASWVAWRDDRVTQAAVAWVLTSVFIRFCEDNALVEPVWIAGPELRRQEALDAQLVFFRAHPEDTDREWLRSAIDYLAGLPATRALVGAHSALHLVSPSGDAVTGLLDFWRRRDDDGALVHDLADPSLSTRFLGDLYQDLSQHAKDTYALLQTPVFVEEFILDRTLEPALAERPLEGFKLIDPTCGSGHFLLGAFDRLLDRWHRHAPGLELQARVQAALDAIHGVDLNPFAIAIARFRLTVVALKACGLTSLEIAPAFAFHCAVGDALLHGPGQRTLEDDVDLSLFTYVTEDSAELQATLSSATYDVVVGNPPYKPVRDKNLNRAYRLRYNTCKGSYALTVPFMERFFDLAKKSHEGQCAGWIGQITSNSFMKREFGSDLIERFLVEKDLQLIVDTSGAYIPGHNREGTPTVVLIARNQRPSQSTVRAVLRGRGEPGRPAEPRNGIVWTSIVTHIDHAGWEDEWINVTDLELAALATHPWSLGGGGAVRLKESLEATATKQLAHCVTEIGFGAVTREDSAYMIGEGALRRHNIERRHRLPIVEGDVTRNWMINAPTVSVWPYDPSSLEAQIDQGIEFLLWPYRVALSDRVAYGSTQLERGLAWFEYSMFFVKRFRIPLSIGYAFKASHNHFVLDRGGKVFKQTAPVIKLSKEASEDEHLALLGALNSSTVCFWLRQMAQHQGGGAAELPWSWTYEFSGGIVERIPLPAVLPVGRGRMLDVLAQELVRSAPSSVCINGTPTAARLQAARARSDEIRAQMVAVQEELDWEVYRLYGLIDEDLTYCGDDLPGLRPGDRAFSLQMAGTLDIDDENSAWFTHKDHRHVPITEMPGHWVPAYCDLVKKRLGAISTNRSVALLERPEHKRRWESEPWEKRQERALRDWLLDRVEDRRFWFDAQGRPLPRSVAQLADEVSRDGDLVSVLALWEGRPDVPVTQSLVRLLADEAVPFLAAYRYKEPGLRKREAWEQTWALQRREDAGEHVGKIEVPPKYTSEDFRKNSYWKARGKLDVPKERFILYAGAGRETDPTPLLGWAGWDHAQQSLALSLVIGEREKDGWGDDRLIPLVAGLAELQPWVDQWHSEVDLAYGVSLAAFCREQLTARAAQVGKTLAELAEWGPKPTTRGRRPKSAEGT